MHKEEKRFTWMPVREGEIQKEQRKEKMPKANPGIAKQARV